MASIANDPGGLKRITFVNKDRQHKAIRLGQVSNRVADEIKNKVEALNSAAIHDVPIDGKVSAWLAKIGDK